MLVGQPGCGKSHIAQSAAYAFEAAQHPGACRVVVSSVRELIDAHLSAYTGTPQELSRLLLHAMRNSAGDCELIIVALDIDHYDAEESAILEHLVRARQVRVIGTAKQVIGAADRLARDPGVVQLAVEPLSIEESEQFLAQVLGVEHVAEQPLQRWHQSTQGNPHALMMLALSAIRRGVVQKVRKTAWVAARDERPPIELMSQLGELTPLEEEALELVAFATPMHEPMLYQLLDAEAVTSLMNRQILTVRTSDDGVSSLTTHLPILTEAINAHMSPVRRLELARICYQALLSDDSTLTTSSRLRLVQFGMQAGSDLPPHWLWQSMRAMSHSNDLRFVLRLALAAIEHEVTDHSAEAMLRAADLAHFLSDPHALNEALFAINTLMTDTSLFEMLPFERQFQLAMSSICLNPKFRGQADLALSEIEGWEAYWQEKSIDTSNNTRACRMRVLALNGRVKAAFEAGRSSDSPHSLEAEWMAAPARTFEALLHVQRGEFQQGASIAETTRQLILLHEISPTVSGDLEGFTVFFAHWARGTTISARQALIALTRPQRGDIEAVHATTGLVDLAMALFATQEARWYDASEITDRLISTLSLNDPFGVAPFAHAISAFALAALGSNELAYEALRQSEVSLPGLSSTLHGYLCMIQLRARHWLREPGLDQQAMELAVWAREQDVPLIELKALDLFAHQTGQLSKDLLDRAKMLATRVDAPVGEAILTHIRALAGAEPGASDPEERLLSELGIWMPLPPVKELTGREREIALFTALGYSSKYIAERLHLSARTIETHLANVYAKLGVDGREGLRRWFAQQREG